MQIILDLPDELVRQVKHRALDEGRQFKDATADLLRKGLAVSRPGRAKSARPVAARVKTDRKTSFPVIQCRRAAPQGQELTPDQVAEILSEQEAEWTRDSR